MFKSILEGWQSGTYPNVEVYRHASIQNPRDVARFFEDLPAPLWKKVPYAAFEWMGRLALEDPKAFSPELLHRAWKTIQRKSPQCFAPWELTQACLSTMVDPALAPDAVRHWLCRLGLFSDIGFGMGMDAKKDKEIRKIVPYLEKLTHAYDQAHALSLSESVFWSALSPMPELKRMSFLRHLAPEGSETQWSQSNPSHAPCQTSPATVMDVAQIVRLLCKKTMNGEPLKESDLVPLSSCSSAIIAPFQSIFLHGLSKHPDVFSQSVKTLLSVWPNFLTDFPVVERFVGLGVPAWSHLPTSERQEVMDLLEKSPDPQKEKGLRLVCNQLMCLSEAYWDDYILFFEATSHWPRPEFSQEDVSYFFYAGSDASIRSKTRSCEETVERIYSHLPPFFQFGVYVTSQIQGVRAKIDPPSIDYASFFIEPVPDFTDAPDEKHRALAAVLERLQIQQAIQPTNPTSSVKRKI